ncbi:hypothetical protein [Streptomyces sp. NPDC004330]|uniref:hypothetical protein n=1 Tax=Streptomyces sp. NPDC004330 TaxID=3364700 RepID=UPI00369C0910
MVPVTGRVEEPVADRASEPVAVPVAGPAEEPAADQAPEPVADQGSEPVAAPVAEQPVAAEDAGPGVPAVAVRPRRRVLRTVGLIAVAAVIGLVGGTAVGYGIQADREPTALPALNQPGLAYPAKPLPKGEEPEPLSAAEDHQAKAQGDLRKLLLPKPASARIDGQDGWESLDAYADDFTRPEGALESELDSDIRRIATRAWRVGPYKRVEISLVQYRSSGGMGASEFVMNQQRIAMRETKSDSLGQAVKGSTNGRYFVYPVRRQAGYLDAYDARAFIQHGDIAVSIIVYDTKKIAESEIRSLAERQLGRL